MHQESDDHLPAYGQAVLAPRILVVEDNPINQQVALRILSRLGYRADLATNGAEAAAAVATGEYAAVLMDCQMPEMDGYAATRRIRQAEPVGTRLPIVALTAPVQPEDRRRCLAAGVDDYLTKPIRAWDLAGALDRWIGCYPR
jgi:CheY-like chemotaxis protein